MLLQYITEVLISGRSSLLQQSVSVAILPQQSLNDLHTLQYLFLFKASPYHLHTYRKPMHLISIVARIRVILDCVTCFDRFRERVQSPVDMRDG